MARYGRGYNIYDAIMRSRQQSAVQSPTLAGKTETSGPQTSRISGVQETGSMVTSAGTYASPFMDPGMTFERTDAGVAGFPIDETTSKTGSAYVEAPEAAAEAILGTYGPYDVTTKAGKAMQGFLSAIDPTPFGMAGLVAGTTTVDPYGKRVAKPSGILGKVAEMNIEKQYEVAKNIQQGKAGFHQFYNNGQLVSIVPQEVFGKEVGYAVLGDTGLDVNRAMATYAASFGYDPRSINMKSTPGRADFGLELEAFVPGAGGFANDGKFVDPSGNVSTQPSNLKNHMGLVSDIYGVDIAIDSLNRSSLDNQVKTEMMAALRSGEVTAEPVVDKDGNTIGYDTGVGSVVQSGDGSIVTTGSDGLVTSGQGIMSKDVYDALVSEAFAQRNEARASDSGYGMGKGLLESDGDGGAFTQVSGREGPVSEQGREDSARGETFFAEGGTAGAEVPEMAQNAPTVAQAGFIGGQPEGIPDGETVADDVPVDVPEGTFVLNAAAVEFMGSADVKKMILEAMQEAEKQGIDIEKQNSTIAKEDLVSLVVSKGEVIIPPQLAEIIGYDRLNKINNRGKAEVQKRLAETEQQPAPQKPPILAKSGGFISSSS